jgi:predicted nucleotidyltransferase
MDNVSSHRKAFESFSRNVEEEMGDSLRKLVLFGSVARGEESTGSDVDVLAVVENQESKDKLYHMAARHSRLEGVYIALIVRTEDEFERTKDDFFTREVMASGEKVV